jgi:hypothetical protein
VSFASFMGFVVPMKATSVESKFLRSWLPLFPCLLDVLLLLLVLTFNENNFSSNFLIYYNNCSKHHFVSFRSFDHFVESYFYSLQPYDLCFPLPEHQTRQDPKQLNSHFFIFLNIQTFKTKVSIIPDLINCKRIHVVIDSCLHH